MNSIIDELKDRKVIRTVVSYAVVAFVIMQLVEIVFPIFDFPKWTAQFVIILLALGLPVSVVVSWIFDRTPEGFVKAVPTSSSVSKTEDNTRPFYAKKRNIFLVAGVVGGLAIGWLVPRGDREAERIAERSIAVLPFDNLSDSKEDEYFSDGITEEIITQLSKVSDLLVISRTSVLQYKGTTKTIREIGEELGVAAILEGSVRRDGDNLRITGQLIDTDSDQHLWADTYDRRMENIFQIQTDVATRIAEALDARISRSEKRSMATVPTQNVEAYTLYLKGRTEYFNYTYEGFEKSIDYYRQALKLDPSYALAYSGMGDSYGQMFIDNQDELYSELSIQSSEKALSINKDLAEGYKARALISTYLGRISEAIDMNKRAIELGYFMAESNLAFAYWWQGDLSKSLRHHLRGRQSDPYNLRVVYILALAYQALEDYDELHNLISDAMEKHPDGFELHDILITQYCIEGNWKKARATMERLLLLRPNDNHAHRVAADLFFFARDYNAALDHLQKMKHVPPDYKIALAYVLLKKWDRGWANTLLDEVIAQQLKRIDEGGDVWSRTRYTLAEAYSVMNDKDSSLNWLEKAVDKGWTQYRWIEIDPRFDTIRDDQRYTQIIDRMKAIVARERMEAGYTS
ncbi:uncharacterized protein METZ01_LOCUS170849 [marine metagenome]|uniref:Uncharacterized protein n=1 Tax=marine metagenome TaxID=408172 RepID=A0A382BW25_9ZZZZ